MSASFCFHEGVKPLGFSFILGKVLLEQFFYFLNLFVDVLFCTFVALLVLITWAAFVPGPEPSFLPYLLQQGYSHPWWPFSRAEHANGYMFLYKCIN